jgi:cystathionine beta-lyase/cystathionine gamma-synthase
MTKTYHIETLAVHAGQQPDPTTGAVIPPIYQTSTFVQWELGVAQDYFYGRKDNPTRQMLKENFAALEGAQYALAYPSGVAAIDAVLRLLQAEDHLVVSNDLYGGTFRLVDKILPTFGLTATFVDMTDLAALEQAIQPSTKLVLIETPSNPYLKVIDIAAVAELAHSRDLRLVVDNTFASPYLQQPLALGADVVVHSATKYLGGHSDVVAGATMLNDGDLYERLHFLQYSTGAIPGPQDCWLLLRGIKTLPLRMERHGQNALSLARWLEDHPAVTQAIYPGLPDHPQHDLARRQMKNFGGMVSFILRGGPDAVRHVVERTKLFALAVSLGGVESLIEVPAGMTHATTAQSALAVEPALVRLSVGIEHVDDLREDLAQALAGL